MENSEEIRAFHLKLGHLNRIIFLVRQNLGAIRHFCFFGKIREIYGFIIKHLKKKIRALQGKTEESSLLLFNPYKKMKIPGVNKKPK